MKRFFLLIALCGIFLQKNCAQGHISFQCKELNIFKSETLKCDRISEDDPGDLSEAWSRLISYFPENYKGTEQRLDLSFPTRVGSYHWSQENEQDKNDSLLANLVYNFNPQVYGHVLDAYPKEFTITITRYDAVKGGVIEGRFEGTMEAFTAWNNSKVSFPVKGDFHSTRNGEGSEFRKLRYSEKEVTNKAIKVFDETLVPSLQNMGWRIESESKDQNLQAGNRPAPFRPLFFCSKFFQIKLVVDPQSDYGRMLRDSAEYYGNLSSKNQDDYKVIGQAVRNISRIQHMQNLEISTDVNDPYLKEDHFIGKQYRLTVLPIPGVGYAYQIYKAPHEDLDPPDEFTQLFFGNWAGAGNAKNYTPYPFVHKQHAAVIENIVVTITGPAAAANEIIKKINWSKLNEAITK